MTRLIQRITPMDPDQGNGGGGAPYTPTDITPNQEAPKPDAVQQRMDELTAQYREQQRMFQQAQEQNMQLMAQLARANQPQVQAPQAPTFQVPEGIDPGIAQMFKAQQDFFAHQMAQQARQLQETVSGQLGQVRMTAEQLQFQQAAQHQPQQVQQLANQLLQQWRQDPAKGGWTPQDAVVHAQGILFSQGKLQAPVQNQGNVRHINQHPQYNQGMPFGAPSPQMQNVQVLPEALPDAVLAKMSPEKQEQYWADRLNKTGGIDQPIVV